MSPLTYIFGWPLLAALALIFVPRNYRVIVRAVALLATFSSMVLAIKMFCQFKAGLAGYQFEQQIPSVIPRHQLPRWRGWPECRADSDGGDRGVCRGVLLV